MPQPWAIVLKRLARVRVDAVGDDESARAELAALATYAAALTALGPSYTDAFATGSPVSSQIAVWYSNIACRPPCEISGWYGVYGVRNSERPMIESIRAGT